MQRGKVKVETDPQAMPISVRSALTTALYLFGGLLLGFGLAIAVSGLPGHLLSESTRNVLGVVTIIAVLILAGAAWGRAMARLTGSSEGRRMAWAGGLSYGPGVLLAAFVLSLLEVVVVERRGGPDLPVHNVFTILFVPAAFIVSSLGGLAIGLANRDGKLAARLTLGGGLAGAAAFLIIDLALDALGFRVGAPRAAERATMITVMMTGNLGTALAAGAVIGALLGKSIVSKPGLDAETSEVLKTSEI